MNNVKQSYAEVMNEIKKRIAKVMDEKGFRIACGMTICKCEEFPGSIQIRAVGCIGSGEMKKDNYILFAPYLLGCVAYKASIFRKDGAIEVEEVSFW